MLPNPLPTNPTFDSASSQSAACIEAVGVSKTADIGQFQFFLFLLEEPRQLLDELAAIGRGKIERVVFQE